MPLPNFAQKGSIIVIEGTNNSLLDGAWKIYGTKENAEKPDAPFLLLESMYKANKSYTTKAFNPQIMRALTDADVIYQDSFLPVGTGVSVEDASSPIKNGLWIVDRIISGNTLNDARISFKKDGPNLCYMTAAFNASTMKIVKAATPKVAVFVKPSALFPRAGLT